MMSRLTITSLVVDNVTPGICKSVSQRNSLNSN